MKIEDLKPAPYNPRSIDAAALDGLGTSIDTFGDIAGIVWNKRSGNLISGHQRIAALKQKHGDKLKIVKWVIHAGADRFPIRVVDWPDEKEKAANITANNPYIAGMFTETELHKVIMELDTSGMADALGDLRITELMNETATTAPDAATGDDTPDDGPVITSSFQVIVQCKDVEEQVVTHKKLTAAGYACKVSTIQADAD